MNAVAADTPLGRNGLRVGPMAYGVAALGNLLRPLSRQEWEGAVPAAWECGVRYFDVAPHYGLGLAERRLGLGLRGRPRDEFLISTKVQPGHGEERFDGLHTGLPADDLGSMSFRQRLA